MNTRTGIDKLIAINKKYATVYSSPETTLARRLYQAQHPTEIGVFKCMDGRLHVPVMTRTALGIIRPWRNLGGKFNLGWPGLLYTVRDWVNTGVSRGHHILPIITYHFSRGDKHRGCKGFGYDKDAAMEFTTKLKNQFDHVFGKGTVYSILCGIETDLDSLILHGDNGEIVDLADITDSTLETLKAIVDRLYPAMPQNMRQDLIPLMQGNCAHIAQIRAENRPIAEAEHKEWILAVGRGFDWLHEINSAFIIGPFDPRLRGAIGTGATLLLDNIHSGRVNPKDGIVLMASAPYAIPAGPERLLAEEKSKFLHDFAVETITDLVPDLLPHLEHLVTTMDLNTRTFNIIK